MSAKQEEAAKRLRRLIRDVPNFPKPGIMFKDITPALRDGAAFQAIIAALVDRYQGRDVDAFAGIESRGFLFAAPLAAQLGKGLILVRKPGKLPWRKRSKSYALEYGTDTLEMHEDAIAPGNRVVVIDDLLATGGTMSAACDLVREAGGQVVEAAFAIELTFLSGRTRLPNTDCFSLVEY